MTINPLLAQFHDRTSLLDESFVSEMQANLAHVAGEMKDLRAAGGDEEDFWIDRLSLVRPYVVKNGVLQIPVKGVLLKDFPYALGGWATGYEYIWQAFKRGLNDPDVKGIALVIRSGGGMVSGNFDLVDRMFEARGKKPIRAFAADYAYSAAYHIASVADSITVERGGGVGSIGVVVTHFEFSKALEDAGWTVNIIRSKPDKMEGNPYEPLSKGARKRIQEEVDELHSEFVASVARNRGMSVEAVDATNAHTFMPQQAIELGLADEIGALDDAITAFEATIQEGERRMAETNKAELEAAVATARAEGRAEGLKEGAVAALARINAIIGSEAAAKRPVAALNAALKTSMSAEEATAFIGTLAEEAKAETVKETPAGAGAPAGMLKAAMDGTANPDVSAGSEGGETQMSRAESTLLMLGATPKGK